MSLATLTLSSAPGAAVSFTSRQHTGTVPKLTAPPNPGKTPRAVTRMAMQTATNGTHPAGWVQFDADGTDMGGQVSLSPDGRVTTSSALSASASGAWSASLAPASTAYLASAVTDTAALDGAGNVAGSVTISLTVPPAGYFVATVTPGTVTLAVLAGAARQIATGVLQVMTVLESRNYVPGWSVTGQASNLTAGGEPISGTQLGWIPAGSVTGGAKLGPPVVPDHPGFGSAGAVLASAAPSSGFGTDTLSADLMLAVPTGAQNGPYAGALTITFVETGP